MDGMEYGKQLNQRTRYTIEKSSRLLIKNRLNSSGMDGMDYEKQNKQRTRYINGEVAQLLTTLKE